jgi:hypothetical protein
MSLTTGRLCTTSPSEDVFTMSTRFMEWSYVYVMIEKLPLEVNTATGKTQSRCSDRSQQRNRFAGRLSAALARCFTDQHGENLILVTGGAGFIRSTLS